MIRIKIPNNNVPERDYIIEIIFSEFLGLKYTLIADDSELNYSIAFEEYEILIRDSFFCYYQNDLSYLKTSALPTKITYAKNEFTIEKNIPVIYGNEELKISENKIVCGIDIFASSYFMLTRWEEYINKKRDIYDRFPDYESIAYKYEFLHRPVVNEYAELIWNMMKKLGFKGKRKKRNFELILTHDVDYLHYSFFKSIASALVINKNPLLFKKHLKYLFKDNPYNTFDFLMTTSERLGVKSHFYFMSTFKHQKYDTKYYLNQNETKSIFIEIEKRGHIIGFHPGFYTYNDQSRWLNEKKRLEEVIQKEIFEGRQHFLRMDVTKTLPILDKNSMEIDSTLGFHYQEGFRCGTGDQFSVFDFLNRKQLRLKERPLIVTDVAVRKNSQNSYVKAIERIQYFIAIGKKYNTGITLLFHNNSFIGEYEGFDIIYKDGLNLKA